MWLSPVQWMHNPPCEDKYRDGGREATEIKVSLRFADVIIIPPDRQGVSGGLTHIVPDYDVYSEGILDEKVCPDSWNMYGNVGLQCRS